MRKSEIIVLCILDFNLESAIVPLYRLYPGYYTTSFKLVTGFIRNKLLEKVPEGFLKEQIYAELFERDYTLL